MSLSFPGIGGYQELWQEISALFPVLAAAVKMQNPSDLAAGRFCVPESEVNLALRGEALPEADLTEVSLRFRRDRVEVKMALGGVALAMELRVREVIFQRGMSGVVFEALEEVPASVMEPMNHIVVWLVRTVMAHHMNAPSLREPLSSVPSCVEGEGRLFRIHLHTIPDVGELIHRAVSDIELSDVLTVKKVILRPGMLQVEVGVKREIVLTLLRKNLGLVGSALGKIFGR